MSTFYVQLYFSRSPHLSEAIHFGRKTLLSIHCNDTFWHFSIIREFWISSQGLTLGGKPSFTLGLTGTEAMSPSTWPTGREAMPPSHWLTVTEAMPPLLGMTFAEAPPTALGQAHSSNTSFIKTDRHRSSTYFIRTDRHRGHWSEIRAKGFYQPTVALKHFVLWHFFPDLQLWLITKNRFCSLQLIFSYWNASLACGGMGGSCVWQKSHKQQGVFCG